MFRGLEGDFRDWVEIKALGVGENPRESLSELAKLGAKLIIQRAVEDEFDAWLGRARYERSRPEYQRGLRNGFRPRRMQTGEGELQVGIPQVREAAEPFVLKLFPRGTKLLRTEPLKALVISARTRVACDIGRPRLRCAIWDAAEILGALQAWTETNGRSPTSIDWVTADINRPNSLTVRRHFGSWNRALRLAGLQAYVPAVQPRNYACNDSEVIQALKDWAAEHAPPSGMSGFAPPPNDPATKLCASTSAAKTRDSSQPGSDIRAQHLPTRSRN